MPHPVETARPRILTPEDRRWSIGAALACVASVGLGLGATLPLLALRMEALGASATLIGFNTAMVGVAHLIVSPMIPALLRRVAMTPFLAGCLVLAMLCVLAFYATDNLLLWFPLRLAMSSAMAGLFMVSEIWINQLAMEKSRGRVMGLYATIFAGAFALGPVMLIFVGTDGLTPFAATAAMMLTAMLPLAAARGRMPRIEGKASRHLLAYVLAAPSATLAALVYGAVETQVFNLLPVFAVRTGETETSAAFFLTVFALGNVALQVPIGILADRMDRRLLLAICAAIGAIGPALIPLTLGAPWALFPVLFVFGGVVVGLYTVGLAMLGQYFSGPDLVSANAAFVVTYSVGLLAGPALGGLAMDAWDPYGVVVSLSAVAGVYVLLALWRFLTRPPRRPGETPTR